MQGMKRNAVFKRIAMVLFDIFAVNISYYLALLVRYYVKLELRPGAAKYVPMFLEFAPYYTAACLIIFFLFKLYHSVWKYSGLGEFNRIIAASLLTSVIQVAGTLLFIEQMPLTYYVLGGFIQFVLVLISRFGYRIWNDEKNAIAARKKASRNVMIVGASETGRRAVKYLQMESASNYRPVCIVDTWGNDDRIMEGLPVVCGLDRIEEAVSKYKVNTIMFADPVLSPENRSIINDIAKTNGLELQNFEASFMNAPKDAANVNNDAKTSNEFKTLDHIALIVSTEKSIGFYEKLGFAEIDRMDRGYDIIVMMHGPCLLEIYIDPTHPARVNRPEALGLRHLALRVDSVQATANSLLQIGFEVEPIREAGGKHFTFLKDPDGLPIELRE